MSTELDRAWNQVNALGGSFDEGDLFNAGYALGLSHALQVIERLGGKDPLVRAAEERADPVIDWPRPSYHKQAVGKMEGTLPLATLAALNGDDTPDEAA